MRSVGFHWVWLILFFQPNIHQINSITIFLMLDKFESHNAVYMGPVDTVVVWIVYWMELVFVGSVLGVKAAWLTQNFEVTAWYLPWGCRFYCLEWGLRAGFALFSQKFAWLDTFDYKWLFLWIGPFLGKVFNRWRFFCGNFSTLTLDHIAGSLLFLLLKLVLILST